MATTFFGPGGPARFSGHVQADYTPPAQEDLLVQPLTGSRWRVRDRRYSEHDDCSLLGFIEEKDDAFKLTQFEHGFQWFYFRSLDEAIAHFTQTPPRDRLAEPDLSSSPSNV